MVAIVSGNGLGVLNSSAGLLGQPGVAGAAIQGNNKEAAYLNIFNGNLSLTDTDDFLTARGVNVALTRTYNAQGALGGASGGAWQYGMNRQVGGLTGTANAAGSSVLRTAADGSVARFNYDATKLAYVTTDGAGAFQSITYNAAANEWTWRGDRNDQLGTLEIYDGKNDGRLSSIKDLAGVRQRFQYNAAGRLSQVTDATGAAGIVGAAGNDQTFYDYDAAGNLTQIRTTLASGQNFVRAHYGYDAQNRLSKVMIDLTPDDGSIADGNLYQTTYTYDGDSNRIAGVSQSDGTALSFTYINIGGAWRVASFTDALGRKTTLDYSVPGRTAVTDPLGLVSVYGYDAAGRLTDITTPATGGAAQVARFYYDAANGNVLRVTDPRGNDTTYGYDANGNRVLERDAAGNTVTRAYNLVTNRLLAEAAFLTPDPDGAGAGAAAVPLSTRYTYDANGRLHYVISAEGRVTEYRYTALGELAAELRYNSTYPLAGMAALTAPTDAQAAAVVTTATFDKSRIARVDYTYDARGLRDTATRYALTSSTGDGVLDGSQSTTRYVYDQAGNLLQSFDGGNKPSSVTYDGLGRVVTQTDALGNTVLNSYDGAANLTVTVRAANAADPMSVTRYTRDAAGQLTSVRQDFGQLSGTVTNAYDADGRLRQSTDAAGRKTYWLYDAAGRKVAQIEHNGSLTEYVYNAANQVVKTIAHTNWADLSLLNDAQGNPLNVALDTLRPAADPDAPNRASWNSYDAAGRLTASVDANGYLTRLVYDGASRLVQTILRAKRIDDLAALDSAGIAASYTAEANATDDRVSRTFYDGDGKVLARLDAAGALTENKYDASGLLIDAITYANLTTPAYRAAAALATLRPAADAANDIHQRYLYNGKQQVVGTIDGDNYLTELTYDLSGNVASRRRYANPVTVPAGISLGTIGKSVGAEDRLVLYSYDERNQLSRESTLGGTQIDYRYDAAGNLISRVAGAGGVATRTSLTRYDGAGHLIAELTEEGAAKLGALGAAPALDAVERIWATLATHYTYNGAGQRQSASDALGNRTLYFYDKMGRQTITIDAAGTVREQQYDDEGLLVKTLQYAKLMDRPTLATLNGGAITGAVGSALLKLADISLDRASIFYYDNSGRLAYSVSAGGQVSGQSYNAYNQVAQRVQYNVSYNTVQLSGMHGGRGAAALRELVGIPNNATGNARSLSYYDANGRLIYAVSAMGEVTVQNYDGIGRVKQATRYGVRLAPADLAALAGTSADLPKIAALGVPAGATNYYDRRGNVVDVVDALAGHTVSAYNAFGEIKSRTELATSNTTLASALDISSRTFYDPAGRTLATIDGVGALTMYRYDASGRLSERATYANRLTAADAAAASAANVAGLADKLAAATPLGTLASDQRVRYYYDAAGRVGATATLQRTLGTEEWSVVSQRYDANGNVLARTAYATLLKVTNPAAADLGALALTTSDAVTHYAYDSLNRLTATAQAQILASDGNNAWGVTTLAYDAQGNIASRTQYANMAYGDAPLANLDTSKYTNAAVDRTTRYAYDRLDRLIYTIDGAGGVTGIVYDNLGRPSRTTTYAEKSKLVGLMGNDFVPATSAADRVGRTVYNLAGQAVYEIDAAGAVTERRYDAYGNVSARVAYATVLDAAARAVLGINAAPDDVKRLLTINAAADRTERFVYDINGQLRFAVNAGGYFTETRYNTLGQVVLTAAYQTAKVFGEATLAAELAAQVTAQSAAATDSQPRLTQYTYDAQGNVLTRIDPKLGKQSYAYDALGRKLTMSNALNQTWTYRYDAVGRVTDENSPNILAYQDAPSSAMGGWGGGVPSTLITTFTYDALGNLSARTEAAYTAQARTTSYEYDRVGRQKATIMPTTMVYSATAAADGNGRTEVAATPVIRVWYDALGNAIVNQGADGAISQKSYDQMGRVAYDIDALGYATGYARNAFGEATALTRYSTKQTAGAWGGAEQTGKDLLRDPANDRTIITRYDLNGRAVKVIEPATALYDTRSLGNRYVSAARTTDTTYNAFGDVLVQQIYGAGADGQRLTEAAATRYYYDARGLKTAQVNVLSDTPGARAGYLSTFEYNDLGKLTRQTDFSAAVTLTDTGYTAGAAGDRLNRNTQYAYDKNGNLASETKVGVDYVNAAGAAVVNGSLATRYTYDALDRQTGVTDALNQVTNTYYDALGRITAVSKQLTATSAQLTEFKRDIYGNALLRIDYAQAANTASGGSVTVAPTVVGATDIGNRVTATSYDINGRAVRVLDAEQYANRADAKATFSSYDMYGHVIRQWRTVTDTGGAARTAWQLNAYDALGRQVWTQTPGNINLVNNTTASDTRKISVYNAFGEVIESRMLLTSTNQETLLGQTKYDGAGRAWFSNAADGIDTVFLHDAQGNVTAQIRSTSTDPARAHELARLGSAMDALQVDQQQRTENQYDLLGRATDSSLASQQNSVLRWQNGAWVKATPVYNASVADSLVVIGRRDDTDKSIALRYRLKPDGAWLNGSGSRLQTVDGYPVFSTGGLASGDYEYQVLMQPANELQYVAATGALRIDATTSGEKDKQVVAMYMLLLGRTPAAPELNYWVAAFNEGATMADIAAKIYVDQEATKYRAGGNDNAVRLLFQNAGRPQPSDADYNASLAVWTDRLNQASGSAALGAVLGALVFASLPAVALRVSAVTNYLLRGGSDQAVVDSLIAHAATAPDNAIAEGTRAAELESQRRQLARLYIGLFSRAPDKSGFDFWAASLAAGTNTIETLALQMLKSDEATAAGLLPATLGTDQYNDRLVTLAYTNLMGRAPSAAELAEAKAGLGAPPSAAHAALLVRLGARVAGELAGGAPVDAGARTLLFQKTTVALAYAAMPSQGADIEQQVAVNKAVIAAMSSADSAAAAARQATLMLQTRALAAKGALDGAVQAAAATPLETLRLQLARVYAVALNRAPDRDGYVFWLNQLKMNVPGTLQAIVADTLAKESANAALYPPSLTDTQFVTRVFTLGMGLAAGSAALNNAVAAWVPKAAGQSRAKLMLDIINAVVLSSDPRDQSMRALLNNKAAVGVTYAVNFAGSDLGQEKAILQLVTDTDIGAAIQYGSVSGLQIAAEAALATSVAAQAAATQTNANIKAVQGIVAAKVPFDAAQTAADANPLAAPLLRAAQLYVTLLMRGAPNMAGLDLAGLSAMAQQMAAGATDVAMAQSILDSVEGRGLFPTTNYSATQFVTQMYRQALGREPDPAGLAFWAAAAPTLASRAQIAVDMVKAFLTNRVEDTNPNKLANQLAQAAFYDKLSATLVAVNGAAVASAAALSAALASATDADTKAKAAATTAAAAVTAANNVAGTNARKVLEVSRLFVGILNRGPGNPIEMGGLNFWTRARVNNVSLESIANSFLTSPEGSKLFAGAVSNEAFIKQIYMQVLRREPAAGDNFWLGQLNAGATRASIALGIITSVTEQTYQAESEYLAKAAFNQRVGDAMQALTAPASTEAASADTALRNALALKNSTAATRDNALNALNAANALTVEGDPAVIAAKAAAPRGAAFMNSVNVKPVIELLVAFSRSADFNSVYALALGGLTGDALMLAAIRPLVLTSLTDRPAFFRDLYTKILQRPPEQAGLDWWVGATAGFTDPAVIAYEFYKGAKAELNKPVAGVSKRFSYVSEFANANAAALQQAYNMANGYAPAQNLAASQIAQKRSAAQTAYSNSIAPANAADLAWQEASSYNAVARLAPAALAAAGTVQIASVKADKAAAASLAAAALMPGVAASLGVPANTTLADYTARANTATTLQKALGLNSTLETAQAALARASVALTTVVQNPVGTTALSAQAAAVTQIYTAVLNRAPTLLELNLSLGSLKNGKTNDDLVAALVAANPGIYPAAMTNDAFVTKIYTQAMGRAPDVKGLRFWSDALNGAAGLTRGALVMSMIRSMTVESINADTLTYNTRVSTSLATLSAQALEASTPARMAATLADFLAANTAAARLEATNFDAAAQAALSPTALYETELTQLYVSLLGRSPEPAALLSAIGQRASGVPLAAIAMGMFDAPETRQRFAAGISDSQFVTDFYRLGLGRAADPAELTAALALLAGGKNSRGQVVISLIKDLYAYNGNDAVKTATRTTFIAAVSTSLERSVGELDRYRAALETAAARSAEMEKAAILTRMTDGTVLGRDSAGSGLTQQGTARTTLDRWGNVLTVSDTRDLNYKVTYQYNYNNQQIDQTFNSLVGATSAHAVTGYDALGRQAAVTDFNGNTTRLGYDASGNVRTETHADGGKVDYAYTLFGERLSVTQSLANNGYASTQKIVTTYAYDHLGHQKTRSSAAVTAYYAPELHATGRPPDMNIQTSQRLVNMVDTYDYDELGRRIASTQSSDTSFASVSGIAVADLNKTTVTRVRYDLSGNVVATFDAFNYESNAAYDALNHKVASRDAEGGKMAWQVDAFGRVTGHDDLAGRHTSYAYDAAGQLSSQIGSGGPTPGNVQNLAYRYADGRLVEINDQTLRQSTSYTYDANGKRLTEKVVMADTGRALQDNTNRYDAQGRLLEVTSAVAAVGANYRVRYGYDNNGNRLAVTTTYTNALKGLRTIVVNNTFDAMNRQITIGGSVDTAYAGNEDVKASEQAAGPYEKNSLTIRANALATYHVGDGAIDSHTITYDAAGNRVKDVHGAAVDTYSYDAAGRLSNVVNQDGIELARRKYDGAGRVIESLDNNEIRVNAYDLGGRLLRQRIANGRGEYLNDIFYLADIHGNISGYDKVGNLMQYQVLNGIKVEQAQRFVNTYGDNGKFDGYQVTRTDASAAGVANVTVNKYYDANGHVASTDGKDARVVLSDSEGHILSKLQNGVTTNTLVANGEVIGSSNEKMETFSSGFESISSSTLSASSSVYIVRVDGETLQGIAKAMWGDSRLWYLIADANGGIGDPDLKVGLPLTLPPRVNTVHNDYATFKPYNAGEALGDTTPVLPTPSHGGGGGCGGLGKLIMVVVAVAVTIYTAGALSSATVNLFTAGIGALTGAGGFTAGALATAAAAGAAGSIASQAVGIAIGAQDGFNWKSVALSAIGSGASAGVGAFANGLNTGLLGTTANGGTLSFSQVAARAAVSSTISQGAGMVAGLQNGFSWSSVAASYASAYVGAAVSQPLSAPDSLFANVFGNANELAVRTVSGFAAGATASILRGGKIDVAQIATDAFGNALGTSLASAISNSTYMQTRGLKSTINAERATRGLEPIDSSDSDSMDTIRDIVEARGRKTVGGRLMGYKDQLQMYGMANADVSDVIGRLSNAFHGRADVTAIPDAEMSSFDKAVLTGVPTPARTAAFGVMAVDDVFQGSGRLVESFGETLAAHPLARYGLEGISFAAGPGLWLAQKAVMNLTPVGEALEQGQAAIINSAADRFSSVGYSADDATTGGLGALTVGSMAAMGLGSALIRLSGLSNILTSVRSRLDTWAPDVSISPFAHELSRGTVGPNTISPGEALRAKYSYMTTEQRAMRLEELAEGNAYRRLQEIESSTPGAHFLEKHGAQTTLQSQLERAQFGANPTTGIVETYANGNPKIPSSATRFLSNRDQLNAIDRAENIYRLTGDVTLAERPINFNYLIGEGYKKTSLTYGQSYSAQVWFRQGNVNTAFPIWGQ